MRFFAAKRRISFKKRKFIYRKRFPWSSIRATPYICTSNSPSALMWESPAAFATTLPSNAMERIALMWESPAAFATTLPSNAMERIRGGATLHAGRIEPWSFVTEAKTVLVDVYWWKLARKKRFPVDTSPTKSIVNHEVQTRKAISLLYTSSNKYY